MENNEQGGKAMHWFVLFVAVGKEVKVKDKIHNLNLDGVDEILIPTITRIVLKKNKKQEQLETLYPSYMFIRANINNEMVDRIQRLEYVYRFLGLSKQGSYELPSALTKREMTRIFQNTDYYRETNPTELLQDNFATGDYVCITNGVFKNLKGYVHELRKEYAILDLEEGVHNKITIKLYNIEKIN